MYPDGAFAGVGMDTDDNGRFPKPKAKAKWANDKAKQPPAKNVSQRFERPKKAGKPMAKSGQEGKDPKEQSRFFGKDKTGAGRPYSKMKNGEEVEAGMMM